METRWRTARKFYVAKTPKHTSTFSTVQEFARDNILSKLPNCAKLFHGIVRNNSVSTLFSRANVIKDRARLILNHRYKEFFLWVSRDNSSIERTTTPMDVKHPGEKLSRRRQTFLQKTI